MPPAKPPESVAPAKAEAPPPSVTAPLEPPADGAFPSRAALPPQATRPLSEAATNEKYQDGRRNKLGMRTELLDRRATCHR
jgi:hypothetical protein